MLDGAKTKQTLNLIWFMMAAGLVAYWLVFHFVATGRRAGAGVPTLIPILAVLAGAHVIGAFAWFRMSMAKIAPQVASGGLERLTQDERSALITRLQSTTIVCLALLESAGVFGLIIGLMGAPQYVVCFIGSSLIGLVFFRTRDLSEVFALIDTLAPASTQSA